MQSGYTENEAVVYELFPQGRVLVALLSFLCIQFLFIVANVNSSVYWSLMIAQ